MKKSNADFIVNSVSSPEYVQDIKLHKRNPSSPNKQKLALINRTVENIGFTENPYNVVNTAAIRGSESKKKL